MIRGSLLHPGILKVLGESGHGSKILIADGNYPFTTGSPRSAQKVFLNLTPGIPKVTDVLQVLVSAIPIEAGAVMTPPDGSKQSIHQEFMEILPEGIVLRNFSRNDFYQQVMDADTALVIATGETRRFANILLTIGVISQEITHT